jgi:hypothetical protein
MSFLLHRIAASLFLPLNKWAHVFPRRPTAAGKHWSSRRVRRPPWSFPCDERQSQRSNPRGRCPRPWPHGPGPAGPLNRLEHASILLRALALTIGRAIAVGTHYVHQFPALATGFVRGEALSRLGAAANNLLVGAHTHQGRRPRPARPFPPFPGFDAFAAWRIAP